MSNRNMAEYTNFQANQTNKKIMQAPGGASSFSLAWSNQKTDYGPQRVFKRANREGISNENHRRMFSGHQEQLKVMPTDVQRCRPLESGNICNHVDQIDIEVMAQEIKSRKKITEQPLQAKNDCVGQRPCIRLNGPPRQNMIFANDYNYWKEDPKTSMSSGRQLQANVETHGQRVQVQDRKTSVKVHNPPGGKQSFTFA